MALRRCCPALLGVALAAATATAQNLVTNGSFEDPVYGSGVHFGSMTGWAIAPDSQFEVWDGYGGPAAAGNQYLEMDNTTCNTISQTVPTSSAEAYLIRFAFGARPDIADNEVEVRWNGTLVGSASADGTGLSEVNWTYHLIRVPGASGSSTLALTNVDTCNGLGAMLDDVSVVQVPHVPALDPHGLALLAGALALLALLALRDATRA